MKNVLELSHEEAKNFFLKSESYVNIDLPIYFNFTELLKNISDILKTSKLSDFYTSDKPYNHENVNYYLYSNKDGKYSWRPLQIINPAIYVELINVITENNNWEFIQEKFNKFQSIPNIECMSIPIVSTSKKKDKAEQILFWWNKIEQESLKLALEFNYVIHTDITNCYGSIYTHTIPWALHGKEEAKNNKRNKSLLGNKIDSLLQSMNYGQTNGIPQGSVLSDFIAEIVLGYIDMKLYEILRNNGIEEFKILRYRDDYRIFSKELHVAEIILKLLSEILLEFNFKLNDKKTHVENDLILSAVKKDKINWIETNKSYSSIQKELLVLYKFSHNFPNSGSLARWLKNIYEKIENDRKVLKYENREVLISILVEIMFKNPRVIPVCIAIISIIVNELQQDITFKIINSVRKKFSVIPNIGLLEIWLQRLIYPIDPEHDFNDGLCKKVKDAEYMIWNIDWLQEGNLKKVLTENDFIERDKLNKIDMIVDKDEFDIFSY